MSGLKIAFNTGHPSVKAPDFEEKLALNLLDVMLGRQMASFPDPVPLTERNGNMRMIGHSNNYWLIRELDGSGNYRVTSRYDSDESQHAFNKASAMIADRYGDCLQKTEETAVNKSTQSLPPKPV